MKEGQMKPKYLVIIMIIFFGLLLAGPLLLRAFLQVPVTKWTSYESKGETKVNQSQLLIYFTLEEYKPGHKDEVGFKFKIYKKENTNIISQYLEISISFSHDSLSQVISEYYAFSNYTSMLSVKWQKSDILYPFEVNDFTFIFTDVDRYNVKTSENVFAVVTSTIPEYSVFEIDYEIIPTEVAKNLNVSLKVSRNIQGNIQIFLIPLVLNIFVAITGLKGSKKLKELEQKENPDNKELTGLWKYRSDASKWIFGLGVANLILDSKPILQANYYGSFSIMTIFLLLLFYITSDKASNTQIWEQINLVLPWISMFSVGLFIYIIMIFHVFPLFIATILPTTIVIASIVLLLVVLWLSCSKDLPTKDETEDSDTKDSTSKSNSKDIQKHT